MVKRVNGQKVRGRWSLASLLTGLLAVCLFVIPILYLSFPFFELTTIVNGDKDGATKIALNAMDLLKTLPFNTIADLKYPGTALDSIFVLNTASGAFYPQIFEYLNFGFPLALVVIWVALAAYGIRFLIFGLNYIFAGNCKKPHKIVKWSRWYIFVNFGCLIISLLCGYGLVCGVTDTAYVFETKVFFPFIFFGVSIVGWILITILYDLGFKNRVFIGIRRKVKAAKKVKKSPAYKPRKPDGDKQVDLKEITKEDKNIKK